MYNAGVSPLIERERWREREGEGGRGREREGEGEDGTVNTLKYNYVYTLVPSLLRFFSSYFEKKFTSCSHVNIL